MSENNTSVNNENLPPINFTDSAAKKVNSLIIEEENPNLSLRVYIMGGGCSGFQYGFKFDEVINPDDIVIEKEIEEETDDDGGSGGSNQSTIVRLLCDPLSFQYLENATIDYREDINGSQFIITNPNAKTTCGCGSSFSA